MSDDTSLDDVIEKRAWELFCRLVVSSGPGPDYDSLASDAWQAVRAFEKKTRG